MAITLTATATTFNVSNQNQLTDAIQAAQNGDIIKLSQNITLTSDLAQVNRNVTIDGGGHTLSGNDRYRGLYIASGSVAINNLVIAHASAQGGNGGNGYSVNNAFLSGAGGGGGGGAGLGGALFVASGATVTTNNLQLQNDQARGGSGGSGIAPGSGNGRTSGGGGSFLGYNGGNGGITQDGSGAAGGGGSGGGGNGGFGGGGGGAMSTQAGAGGFGGGGGGVGQDNSGHQGTPGAGGFGASAGGGPSQRHGGVGGSGAAMGGAIFIQQGGALNLAGSLTVSGNTVTGGKGADGRPDGQAYGSGIFLQGNGSFTVSPTAGVTQTISDAIADQTGIAGNGGSWALIKQGAGTTILTGANTYSGGTTVSAGILQGTTAGLQRNIAINNATVVFDQASNGTYAGSVSGQGTLIKRGAGTITLTGNNTFNGPLMVNGGALLFGESGNLGGTGTVSLNGSTIGAAKGSGATVSRPLVISNGASLYGRPYGEAAFGTAFTWSGPISGTGPLVKSGPGEVVLTGTNSYTGGTTINEGILRVTTGANLGAANTPVTIKSGAIGSDKSTPAATIINRNLVLAGEGGIDVALHPITWGGTITGNGNFVKSGPGELTFTQAPTNTGNVIIEKGALFVSSDAMLGAPNKSLVFRKSTGTLRTTTSFAMSRNITLGFGGAAFLVQDGATLTLNGVLSNEAPDTNSPNITKLGDGTLILNGTNTYTGATYINGGTLQGTASSIKGKIMNNAALVFNQVNDGTYADVISGTGSLTKTGTGKLSLPGIQLFTGPTHINAGNLNVNGSLESSSVVNVNPGGTLSGNGKFGHVKNNGGTISPGNSIGRISIADDLVMLPGSTYYAQINGDTSDYIHVAGTADIQSSTFVVAHDSDPSTPPVLPGKTYTLLTADHGLTAVSTTTGVADFPFIQFTLSKDAHNGYLSTARGPEAFSTLASTPNQVAVANMIDHAGSANPIWQRVVGSTEAQARSAFSSLSSASFHANIAAALSTQSAYVRDALLNRMQQGHYGEEDVTQAGVTSLSTGTAGSDGGTPAVASWIRVLGSRGSLAGNDNAASIDSKAAGFLAGLDATFNHRWRIGAAAGYTRTTFDSTGINASGTSDSYHLGLYGDGQLGAWGLRSGASISWNNLTTSRGVVAGTLAGSPHGDYLSKTTQVFGEVGRRFQFARGSVEPFANLAYVHVDGDVDEGGLAAMNGSSKLSTTYSTLGLHGEMELAPRMSVKGTLGWRHAMGDVTPVARLAFAQGGSAVDLSGAAIARDALVSEASFHFAVNERASVGLSWAGQFARHNHDNAMQAFAMWRF